MKKVLSIVTILSMAASVACAGELGVKGTFVESVNTGGKKTVSKSYGFGKGRIKFEVKANDQVKFTLENKIEGAAGANGSMDIDYAFADIALLGGDAKLRVGTVTDETAGFGGGIYQTNTFQDLTRSKGSGIEIFTKVGDVNLSVANISAPIDKDATKVYAAKASTTISGAGLGAIVKYGSKGDDSGLAAELEASYKVGPVKVSGQYYMDLSDKAATVFKSKTKKQSFLGLYAEYDYGMGKFYVDDVLAANDDTKETTWKKDYELSAGISYVLNDKAAVYFEMVQSKPNGKDAEGSSSLGMQIGF